MGRKSCVAIADVTKLNEVQSMIETSVKELGELNTMYVSPKSREGRGLKSATKA